MGLLIPVYSNFLKGIFPRVTSQVATSQMCNVPSGNFPKVRFGLRWARGPSAAAMNLWSWCLGNWTFGKLSLGKISLGSSHLGKILTGDPYRALQDRMKVFIMCCVPPCHPVFDANSIYFFSEKMSRMMKGID